MSSAYLWIHTLSRGDWTAFLQVRILGNGGVHEGCATSLLICTSGVAFNRLAIDRDCISQVHVLERSVHFVTTRSNAIGPSYSALYL